MQGNNPDRRAKSELLAEVSRELRTPLNAILGMSQLALRENVSPAVREYLEAIETAAYQLADVANEISDYADIVRGHCLELTAEPFQVRDSIDRVARSLSIAAAEQGIILRSESDTDLPSWIVGDEARFRQVLRSICNYAIANATTQTVWIRAAADDSEAVAGRTILVVSASADFAVTTAAEGGSSSPTAAYKAFGLGLCGRLAAAMGGTVTCESETTGRVRVRVSLPVQKCEGGPNRLTQSRRLKILLAEDVHANQTIVTRLLESQGHDVVVANDGQKAIEQFQLTDFDAVLMDVQMPIIDGYVATEEIRRAERAKSVHTPIIGMTAHASQQVREECLRAGMDEYLPKPIDLDKLLAVLNGVVTGLNITNENQRIGRSASASAKSPSLLNIDDALRRLGGDADLFKEFVEVFDEDCPALCDDIQEGIVSENVEQIARAAHKLQGLSVNLGAQSIQNIALLLEQACESHDLRKTQGLMQRLEQELSRLNLELDSFR